MGSGPTSGVSCSGTRFRRNLLPGQRATERGTSLLANALLLQRMIKSRTKRPRRGRISDLRWKVACGIEVDDARLPRARCQLFRAQLILKEKMRSVFTRSLEFAKQMGYLKARRLKAILDTTNILGRGAVKDTYNLLGMASSS